MRVWLIEMHPSDRVPFHTHVFECFLTAISPVRAQSRYSSDEAVEVDYEAGSTMYFGFKSGELMTQDLEIIGDTVLTFITVEFLNSENVSLL